MTGAAAETAPSPVASSPLPQSLPPPSDNPATDGNHNNTTANPTPTKYRALVLDSGPIIRMASSATGSHDSLWQSADHIYTVPAVLGEIRDPKARAHLETIQTLLSADNKQIQTRVPNPKSLQRIVDFSRNVTGDYHSLSSVDLQVLALLYELEQEGCGSTYGMGHIRTPDDANAKNSDSSAAETSLSASAPPTTTETKTGGHDSNNNNSNKLSPSAPVPPKTWANLVDRQSGGSSSTNIDAATSSTATSAVTPVHEATRVRFANLDVEEKGGQFSDAEESSSSDDDDDDDDMDSNFDDISDEECDVYILDPEEVEAKELEATALEQELELDFPSLEASRLVPYNSDDDEDDDDNDKQIGSGRLESLQEPKQQKPEEDSVAAKEERERLRKEASLKPVSNSGKLYNSFRKYGKLMKPKPAAASSIGTSKIKTDTDAAATTAVAEDNQQQQPLSPTTKPSTSSSRILGGMGLSGQEADYFEDDGEGWISTTKEISTLKATGKLEPGTSNSNEIDKKNGRASANRNRGPPISHRAACATTDFAMQNVILQMNLELLSVDGIKIRKLKSWVMRCGACYKVYTNKESRQSGTVQGKRLFCDHCGSDMMQRIAASVDSKTGKLRLHLKKGYKHNLRGTKFSLPKPGSGNRFQGDLLLREDQLLVGAWNQKVKMRSGGKARSDAQSIFGRDIASNVGCHLNSVSADDIRVGFGRRNPNAAKGRERRGKKKKSTDRACGLRRY